MDSALVDFVLVDFVLSSDTLYLCDYSLFSLYIPSINHPAWTSCDSSFM